MTRPQTWCKVFKWNPINTSARGNAPWIRDLPVADGMSYINGNHFVTWDLRGICDCSHGAPWELNLEYKGIWWIVFCFPLGIPAICLHDNSALWSLSIRPTVQVSKARHLSNIGLAVYNILFMGRRGFFFCQPGRWHVSLEEIIAFCVASVPALRGNNLISQSRNVSAVRFVLLRRVMIWFCMAVLYTTYGHAWVLHPYVDAVCFMNNACLIRSMAVCYDAPLEWGARIWWRSNAFRDNGVCVSPPVYMHVCVCVSGWHQNGFACM